MTARQGHPKDEEPEEETPAPKPKPAAKGEEWPGGTPLTSGETAPVPEEEWSATKVREEG
jgi:hypothetical protein